MYFTWTKVEAKEFTQLGKKFVKSLLGKSKHTHVDEAKTYPRRLHFHLNKGK